MISCWTALHSRCSLKIKVNQTGDLLTENFLKEHPKRWYLTANLQDLDASLIILFEPLATGQLSCLPCEKNTLAQNVQTSQCWQWEHSLLNCSCSAALVWMQTNSYLIVLIVNMHSSVSQPWISYWKSASIAYKDTRHQTLFWAICMWHIFIYVYEHGHLAQKSIF